jgi:Flp pilus assembly protein TadD
MALLRLGKFEDSIAAYDKALATRPKQAESLMGRALALAGKGDLVRARADAKAARQQDPDIDETFARYGLKFEDQNRLTSK